MFDYRRQNASKIADIVFHKGGKYCIMKCKSQRQLVRYL